MIRLADWLSLRTVILFDITFLLILTLVRYYEL